MVQLYAEKTNLSLGKGIIIDDFLPKEKYYKVLDFALDNETEFRASQTVTNEADYRESSLLFSYKFPRIYEWMKNEILKHFPRVCRQLNHRYFAIAQIEMQMTAHNDGNFYKLHNDSGSETTNTRELTYVYYFYREPQAFSGGELQLYDTVLEGKQPINQMPSQLIKPRNNRIVFFDSACQHEVLTIHCPSRAFQDSRFTLNGWLRI